MALFSKRKNPPSTGEKTNQQLGTPSLSYGFSGWLEPQPPAATYETYEHIFLDPTVYLAMQIHYAPIKSSTWSVETTQNAPSDAKEYLEEQLFPMKDHVLQQAMYALIYGWQAFEKVFEPTNGELTLTKLKALHQKITKIKVDRATGKLTGLKADNGITDINLENTYIYTHEQQAGDYYGQSRLERLRCYFHDYEGICKRHSEYLEKVANVIAVIYYPPGQAKDQHGRTISTLEMAKELQASMKRSGTIAIPDQTRDGAHDFIKKGVPPEKLRSWSIEFLEQSTDHSSGFIAQKEAMHKLFFRALGVPEKLGLEGSYNTRGTAERQSDIALMISDQTNRDILRSINSYIVHQLMVLKYGLEAIGTAKVVAEPLHSERRNLIYEIIRAAATPQNYKTNLQYFDYDAILREYGMPFFEGMGEEIAKQALERFPMNNPNDNADEGQPGEPRTQPDTAQQPNTDG